MMPPRLVLLLSLALPLAGCAASPTPGPIVAVERAELRNGEFPAVEFREHPNALTYGLIAHDGVLVVPRSPEDESWLLNPEDEAMRIIERLNHTVPLGRRSVTPYW